MTRVVLDRAAGELTLSGHAGSAEAGRDLVCAALSALMYTAAAQPGARSAMGEGWCVIAADRAALAAVCRGFGLLAESFPRHVSYREVSA